MSMIALLLFYPFTYFFLLDIKLIAQCNLEYTVLWVAILTDIGHAKVVTTIENEVVILVRQTNRDRKVKCVYLRSMVFIYHETRLKTKLDCETWHYINIGHDRHVDIAWVPFLIRILNFGTLTGVEQTGTYRENLTHLILCFSTTNEVNFIVTLGFCGVCNV